MHDSGLAACGHAPQFRQRHREHLRAGNFSRSDVHLCFSSPQSGGDIGISTASMASLFPNLVELTLTLSSQTAPGVRSLFITTPNSDVAVASGVLEVK